jgi:hypothetical protein
MRLLILFMVENFVTRHIEIGGTLKIITRGLDMAARGLDMAARGLDMAARGLDMAARGLDMAARGLDMAARGLDMTARGLDMVARGTHDSEISKKCLYLRPFSLLKSGIRAYARLASTHFTGEVEAFADI